MASSSGGNKKAPKPTLLPAKSKPGVDKAGQATLMDVGDPEPLTTTLTLPLPPTAEARAAAFFGGNRKRQQGPPTVSTPTKVRKGSDNDPSPAPPSETPSLPHQDAPPAAYRLPTATAIAAGTVVNFSPRIPGENIQAHAHGHAPTHDTSQKYGIE